MTDEPPVYINDSDVDALNSARDALARIAAHAHRDHDTQASGMVFALAQHAEEAVFDVMNYARSHGGQRLADAAVYNSHDDREHEEAGV